MWEVEIVELSKDQRLVLYNQYEILKGIYSNDEHMVDTYNYYQEILVGGYKAQYDELISGFYDELPIDIHEFVFDILQLHRVLFDSYENLMDDEKKEIDKNDIIFDGFDGNEEFEYYRYTESVLTNMQRYSEIYDNGKVTLNSHARRVPIYKRMLDAWEGKKQNLNFEDIKKIISAKIY